jgi:hypothetical protein
MPAMHLALSHGKYHLRLYLKRVERAASIFIQRSLNANTCFTKEFDIEYINFCSSTFPLSPPWLFHLPFLQSKMQLPTSDKELRIRYEL